jgi:ketosteroid isomerase-like protein
MADASSPDPATLLARYHAALDRLDFDTLQLMFAPDAVYLSNGVGSLKGRDEIIAAFRDYFGRYAHEESVDTRIEEIDARTVRSHWRLVARDREGRRLVRREGVETIWFDESGRIVSVMVDDARP